MQVRAFSDGGAAEREEAGRPTPGGPSAMSTSKYKCCMGGPVAGFKKTERTACATVDSMSACGHNQWPERLLHNP